MNINKKTLIGGIIAVFAVLFLGVIAIKPTPSPATNTVTKAVTSPDLSSPYISWGGVRHWSFAQQMVNTQGASTTCQILSPAATTTLTSATAYFTALASTSPIQIGYSYTATSTRGQNGVQYDGTLGVVSMSTSTLLSSEMYLPTGGGLVVATTSVNSNIIPPYTIVNTKIGGGQLHTPGITTGVCTASFREVQGQ